MSEPVSNPSLERLRRHLESAEFESGVAGGLWRIVELRWPILLITIRVGDSGDLGMRLAVDGYPVLAPAGRPWELAADAPLPANRWPAAGTGLEVFRPDWSTNNEDAPYLPCDRIGLSTHAHWATENPSRAWNPTRTITFYLNEMHRYLSAARLPEAGR